MKNTGITSHGDGSATESATVPLVTFTSHDDLESDIEQTKFHLSASASAQRKGKAAVLRTAGNFELLAAHDTMPGPSQYSSKNSECTDICPHILVFPSSRTASNPARVTLLQTTLSSSQSCSQSCSQQPGRKCRLPLSGHWAVEIRGEVFELNHMESWQWGWVLQHQIRSAEGFRRSSWKCHLSGMSTACYAFWVFRPQVAGRAHIDTLSYDDYMGETVEGMANKERVKWTENQILGVTYESQNFIRESSE